VGLSGTTKYFVFYNEELTHQSLENKTPKTVYASASEGNALILDGYLRVQQGLSVALLSAGTFPAQIENQKQSQTRTAPSSCEGNREQLKLNEILF
jgi:hypothetical protein